MRKFYLRFTLVSMAGSTFMLLSYLTCVNARVYVVGLFKRIKYFSFIFILQIPFIAVNNDILP